jgi:hypothetical protein
MFIISKKIQALNFACFQIECENMLLNNAFSFLSFPRKRESRLEFIISGYLLTQV